MNKKRVLAMLLAGAMALSMTACGGGNSASTDDSSNDGGASASGGSYKVSVILKTLAAEYWQYVKSGAEDYASEHSDKVTVEVKGPSSETAFDEMQNMIETDLSSGTYDGIVISPLQSDTAAQLVMAPSCRSLRSTPTLTLLRSFPMCRHRQRGSSKEGRYRSRRGS